jgi:glyoxylase-like metal-dependent hydrolase (beta-lactamase superfamily II)
MVAGGVSAPGTKANQHVNAVRVGMFFRQYQLSCLSLFSYLIGDESSGRAVVVDPQRDITGYVDDAQANGLAIERVIETHFHADFLSGHLELAEATGAVICYGSDARAEFPIERLAHGQRLELGDVVLEIRHNPATRPSRSRWWCGSTRPTRCRGRS